MPGLAMNVSPFSTGIHLWSPAAMIASLLLAMIFAVGHHLFYTSLAGHSAPTGTYNIAGHNISRQQFNTAIGTTFAFLVKSNLSVAISIAYVQALWHAVRGSRKGLALSTVDTISSILTNAFNFWKVHVWYKYPLLLILAIVSWCIPIASIVTPATLSVQELMTFPAPSNLMTVPNLEFTSLDFNMPFPVGGSGGMNQTEYCYNGPSQQVQRVATAVGAQGQILNIDSPSSNATWTTKFFGPTMTCSDAPDSDREQIFQNFIDYLSVDEGAHCSDSFGYLAWVPTSNSIVPFVNHTSGNQTATSLRDHDLLYGANMSLYVAVMPRMFTDSISMATHTLPTGCQIFSMEANYTGAGEYFGQGNATLLECTFTNASYTADFNYINGNQQVGLSVADTGDALTPQNCVTGPESQSNGIGNGTLGNEEALNPQCSTLNTQGQPCLWDEKLVRTLSHQGVVDSFVQLVRGTIGLASGNSPFSFTSFNSSIAKTALMDTQDLAFTRTWHLDNTFRDMPTIFSQSNGSEYVGISNAPSNTSSRGSLKDSMETMFKNLTVSLMSEPILQPNYTSAYAPERLTNVTFTTYHNIYVYSRNTLWAAYGTAIAVTLVAVIVGFVTMSINGASYDGSFSTVLRVARTASLTEEVKHGEEDGRLPLPNHLARARLVLRGAEFSRSGTSSLEDVAEGANKDGSGNRLLKVQERERDQDSF